MASKRNCFDFFHYWAHRFFHSHPLIYQWIHKRHHKYHNPSAENTFFMTPIDLILSHCLPLLLTIMIFDTLELKMDQFWFISINFYLTFLEVGGHMGKKMRPTSSFAQFIWLPRWFSIQLYTEDHHKHHQN